MVYIKINGIFYNVPEGATILEVCLNRKIDVELPRFCYHELLSIAGNCRMCLVEVKDAPKTLASCAISVSEGMEILTNTALTKFARENVLEFLLMNHPLDCPICDQGGECDLQDLTIIYGNHRGRFYELKRSVMDKDMGPFIKTVMNRCIHCTRCIRYCNEISGLNELGMTGRGNNSEISNYIERVITSEISGNVIDICPVGALTAKTYEFKGRPWEIEIPMTIDPVDPLNSNITLGIRGLDILRVLPTMNVNLNGELIDDRTRFFYDGLRNNRLSHVYLKKPEMLKTSSLKDSTLEKVDWETAIIYLDLILKNLYDVQQFSVIGKYNDLETITAFKNFTLITGQNNMFMEHTKMSKKIVSFRNDFLFNYPLDFLLNFENLILIGLNPTQDVPIFSARIRQLLNHKKLNLFVLGSPIDLRIDGLKYLGSNVNTIFQILEGRYFEKQLQKTLFIIGTSFTSDMSNFLPLINKYLNKQKNEQA